MPRTLASLLAAFLLMSLPANASYHDSRASFEGLAQEDRATVILALIAAGDLEALALHGFTPALYKALRAFEQREGMPDDGVVDEEQLRRLGTAAADFRERIGARYYTNAQTGARLLVPRRLFDAERQTPEGLLFTRNDGLLSLLFISFPQSERTYDDLWRTLSGGAAGKSVIYQRRFDSRFVVTGSFRTSKFYTMMLRTGGSTTGFTFSWGAPMEGMGRKISTFLANAFAAEQR